MRTLHAVMKDIADRHEDRMRNEPLYRDSYFRMKESTKPVERSRHYDRDGYCDNPNRGY